MSISYEKSIKYFQKHLKGHLWTKAGQARCESAINQARRVLSRALGRELDDDEAVYSEGDRTRDEYAAYEQAIHMIEHSVIADGSGAMPIAQLTADADDPDKASKRDPALLAPEALRWLGVTGNRIVLIKG